MIRIFAAAVLLFVCVAGARADEAQPPLDVRLYIDNDTRRIMPLNDSDRWYTSGVGASVAWPLDESATAPLPFDDAFTRRALGVVIGQQIFTPEDTELEIPDSEDDRPYAGYLFAGVFYQRAADLDGPWATMDHLQLDVGIVGKNSLAEESQNGFHEFLDTDEARGWDAQLRDELTVQIGVTKKWRHRQPIGGAGSRWACDTIPQVGVALGTVHRNVNAGVTLRAGWQLPDDFGPARLMDVSSAAVMRRPAKTGDDIAGFVQRRGLGAYAFIRLGGRVVEHNLFVNGSDFRDGPGETHEPLVGEVQFGLALAYHFRRATLELLWAQTYTSDEFEDQDHTQSYGTISGAFTWWF